MKGQEPPRVSPGNAGPPGTHRWVKDLSPRKVALESAWMSLFSMNLGREEMVA